MMINGCNVIVSGTASKHGLFANFVALSGEKLLTF